MLNSSEQKNKQPSDTWFVGLEAMTWKQTVFGGQYTSISEQQEGDPSGKVERAQGYGGCALVLAI